MYKKLIGLEDTSPDFTSEDFRKMEECEELPEIDLKSLSIVDLIQAFDECPAVDYPLGEELLAEILSRAGVDIDETDEDGNRIYEWWGPAYEEAIARLQQEAIA